jgi:excisionase family DNA binding protein
MTVVVQNDNKGELTMENPTSKPYPPRADGTSAPAFRYARVQQAMTYVGVGKTKVYQLMNDGKITAFKDGRRTWVCLDSIDAYYASLPKFMPKSAAE